MDRDHYRIPDRDLDNYSRSLYDHQRVVTEMPPLTNLLIGLTFVSQIGCALAGKPM